VTVIRLNNKGANLPRRVYFPFESTEDSFEQWFKKYARWLPDQITDFLRSLRTYRGGDDFLYALTQISGQNKHWSVTPAVVHLTHIKINRPAPDGRINQQFIAVPGGHERGAHEINEVIVFTAPDNNTDYHLELLLAIRFQGVPPLLGKAEPMMALRQYSERVTGIIDHCETIMRQPRR
jgi:hypothetical protein